MHPVIAVLASARISRFITTDQLGEWLIHEPIDRALMRRFPRYIPPSDRGEGGEMYVPTEATHFRFEDSDLIPVSDLGAESPDWVKYRDGLECPFCIGFWAGLSLLAADAVLPQSGMVRRAFDLGINALALNYVAGHISSRLDADPDAHTPLVEFYNEDGDLV